MTGAAGLRRAQTGVPTRGGAESGGDALCRRSGRRMEADMTLILATAAIVSLGAFCAREAELS